MKILTILDYSTGTTVVLRDPANGKEDFCYDTFITTTYGKMTYHYMVGVSLDIEL